MKCEITGLEIYKTSEVKKDLDKILKGLITVKILYCDHCGMYHKLKNDD